MTSAWIDLVLVLLILTNLLLLGSSRLRRLHPHRRPAGRAAGRAAAARRRRDLTLRVLAVGRRQHGDQGRGAPAWLLLRAPCARPACAARSSRSSASRASLLVGLAAARRSAWLGGRLPLPPRAGRPPLLVPVALFTMLIGLFLIVSRRKAVMQVLGYLAMENGIYAFGMALAVEEPLLVEMGVLLDVFVAVFVMGIAIYHISREFDHIDTDRLSALKD